MILDSLKNAKIYYTLHKDFKKALEFLERNDQGNLAPGRHEIDGDNLFALVNVGTGRGKQASKLEVHKKYIDIQFTVTGTDVIGWKPASECGTVDKPYDDKAEVMLFSDSIESWFNVPAGKYAVFFPDDAHAPLSGDGPVRKIIMKVKI